MGGGVMVAYDDYADSGVDFLGRLPTSWRVTRIANVFEERKIFGNPKEELLSLDRYRGVIKQSETGRKVRAPRDRNGYKLIEPGELCYNILNAFMGSVGVSRYRGIVSPAYAVARFRDEQEPWYFHYLLRTPLYQRQFNRFSYGIMYERNRLYYDRFKVIPIPVPPKMEQEKIVAYLRVQDARIARYIKARRNLIALLTEQKLSIIDRAVTRGLDGVGAGFKPALTGEQGALHVVGMDSKSVPTDEQATPRVIGAGLKPAPTGEQDALHVVGADSKSVPADEQAAPRVVGAVLKPAPTGERDTSHVVGADSKSVPTDEQAAPRVVGAGLKPAPTKPSGVAWLGEVPEHWEVQRLKNIADVVLGKMLTTEAKGDGEFKPYLRSTNVQWLIPDVRDVREMWIARSEMQQLRVRKGDLLVSEGGEVGRTCRWNNELSECYIQNSVHRVVAKPVVLPDFLLHQFFVYGKRGRFNAIVNRVSIAHLTREKLVTIPFVVPTVAEQQAICRWITDQCQPLDKAIAHINDEIALIREYRDRLIFDAVTGQVDVRGWRPGPDDVASDDDLAALGDNDRKESDEEDSHDEE
jgi:type I restriction enzyme S subunit